MMDTLKLLLDTLFCILMNNSLSHMLGISYYDTLGACTRFDRFYMRRKIGQSSSALSVSRLACIWEV